MKKLLLIVATIVFIGNITGQRQKEELIPLSSSKSNDLFESGTIHQTQSTRCTLISVAEKNPQVDYLMDHMFMNTYNSTDILIGGIPGKYGDVKVDPIEEKIPITTFTIKDDHHHGKNTISPITVTAEDIKRMPSVTGEADIIHALSVMGCPRETSSQESTSEISALSQEEQGPFTGLEGHNFIEHPAIIYPNPVKDILQVKSTDPITVIEILGITGQLEILLDTRSTMDVSTLAAGTYYVRIYFENIKDVQVEKIIVVK